MPIHPTYVPQLVCDYSEPSQSLDPADKPRDVGGADDWVEHFFAKLNLATK